MDEAQIRREESRGYRDLALRNKSRYDRHALIGNKEAKEVLKLTKDMIRILDKELEVSSA